jgi:hypothetical protein
VLRTLGEDGRPTYEDLKSMKYMQHCLNEGIPPLTLYSQVSGC